MNNTNLLESSLNVQLDLCRVCVDENKLSQTVERVGKVVEGVNVGVAKHGR